MDHSFNKSFRQTALLNERLWPHLNLHFFIFRSFLHSLHACCSHPDFCSTPWECLKSRRILTLYCHCLIALIFACLNDCGPVYSACKDDTNKNLLPKSRRKKPGNILCCKKDLSESKKGNKTRLYIFLVYML